MRRAWQRSLTAAALAFVAAIASPSVARAYHAGAMFDRPPGAGGGGGIFYTGSPLEHGWNCTLCHEDAPGKVRVLLKVEPSELFQTFTLVPGQTYSFTATLDGETLGKSSPLSNYNTIAASFTDAKGIPVGSVGGFAAEDFYSGNASTIVSAGQKVGVTSWSFQYTAPDASAGPVTLHLAAVDGNGANSPPTKTLTDPFGDDVFVAAVNFQAGALANAPLTPTRTPPRPSTLAFAVGIGVALSLSRAARRKRRR